jgi:putative endonuclease
LELPVPLRHRVHEHREGFIEGFTKQYQVNRLVWFELHADFPAAIAREKQLKKWSRVWKMKLIENANPGWRDLWDDIQE